MVKLAASGLVFLFSVVVIVGAGTALGVWVGLTSDVEERKASKALLY